ncbi:MarR family winged helix-turn-helix transcriptional regulator [Anoxynatronum buryatiense]|uniref:Transcriptional regulator, MarR family n=1 Tax=Anoxynatronum buryatiense TaxID=489973 RepID=A0AA45WUC7_9CLOT|nr:MarR family transcriptional regulator [Anoxynatronum buryatiense]SMP45705.1 transcriptional regulator, MarR family [Anoxynatronum buryatiense]
METQDIQDETLTSLKLFVVLNRAARSVNDRIAEDIRSHGLNPTEFAVLELLYHKGDQPVQVIGKKVLIASSSITYVVDKLQERGYVERSACPNDRRVIYTKLTGMGRDLMEKIFPEHAAMIQQLFSHLTVDEKAMLAEQLKSIGRHAQGFKMDSARKPAHQGE